jgi:hypothetical protein
LRLTAANACDLFCNRIKGQSHSFQMDRLRFDPTSPAARRAAGADSRGGPRRPTTKLRSSSE